MSKIYEKYLQLRKEEKKDTLYVFASGIFFIFVQQDATLVSHLFGLKLTNLNENVVKCGFPKSSFEKYNTLLEKAGYHLEIINLKEENNPSLYQQEKEEIKKIAENVSQINVESLSISQVYDTLYQLQNQVKTIIQKKE